MPKPVAESCIENRAPIADVLLPLLADRTRLLEIGSGTGQHAVYFAPELPHLIWQPSDLPANLPGIEAWCREAALPNIAPPLPLDVQEESWPAPESFDAVFSANTVHIMGWPAVEAMFAGIGRTLVPDGLFSLYGPFNYGGQYTSPSNARFDGWLKQRDPASGIRDFEAVCELGAGHGLVLADDFAMPANNRMLVWRRRMS